MKSHKLPESCDCPILIIWLDSIVRFIYNGIDKGENSEKFSGGKVQET
jgi:hypothetical protein